MIVIKSKMDKEEVNGMPRQECGVGITVVDTPQDTEKAVRFLKGYDTLGIDSETRPSFRRGDIHKVALLQVSTDERCFLFRLNKTGLTLPLIELLESSRIRKVGLSLKDDYHALHQRAPFTPANTVDLQDVVRLFGIQDMSLQKIYANLFGKKISKAQRLSNWEAASLTIPQQEYAAIDAWSCLKIYEELEELRRTGDFMIRKTEDESNEDKQDNTEAR